MAQRSPAKRVHTTMRGKVIDLDGLRQRNELTPAVGNAKVNARGDLLGKGGKIVKSKDTILKEYYEQQNSVPDELAVSTTQKTNPVKETQQEQEAWIEDDDGNFVAKKPNRSRSK